MAEASTIGANFSNYQGDVALGGGTFGSFQLDTRPLQDFARYTMLYNREEYLQRQKEAEKAAEELAKLADYDLTTSIQKDAKVLQEKYDKVVAYARDNPNATRFGNRKEWLEFQKLKNDLSNDIRGAKVRSLMNVSREKQIADEKDESVKKFMREELDKEIAAKDIRTPIFFTQEYDMTVPDFGANKGQSVVVNKWLANQITQDTFEFFDAAEAKRKGAAFALSTDFDTDTTTGKLKGQKFKTNFYVKGAELLNQAVANAAVGIDQNLSDAEKDLAIKSKLSGIGIIKNVDAYNKYMQEKQREIASNIYTDRNRKKLNPEDYQPINWKDGLAPEELYAVVEFTNWAGDKQETKIIQTNDAIERARIGLGYANLDLERQKMLSSQTEDWISADAVVREVQDAIKMAVPQNHYIDGKFDREVRQIADPNLLREFGTIDKDGNTTNVPDVVNYDPKTNQLMLTYYKREENKDGQMVIKKGKIGNEIEREVPLNPTQWIGQITKRKNPNKDIGGVNAIVEQIYTKNGRNLVELANNYGGQGATGTTKKTTTQSASSTKKLTPEQEAFIKKYGIKQ